MPTLSLQTKTPERKYKTMIQIKPNLEAAYKLFHDGILAFARAEQQGMRIDLEYCKRKNMELTQEIESLETQFKESKLYKHWNHTIKGTPNINSNYQLAHFLYNTKKITPAKITVTGKGATDEEALEALNIPELNLILKARKLKKLRDTYLKAFEYEQVNGYIHPFFNLHTVRTYRSSSDSPNFQNIPKRDKEAMLITRKAIYPRPGHQLLEVDFGSLEVRIAACYHQDPAMLKYIKDPTTDMHRDMAEQIFKIDKIDKKIPEHSYLRAATKNGFVFPQFYGDYYKNCALSMAGTWCKLPEGKWKKGQGIDMPGGGTISDHFIEAGIKSMDDFISHIRKIENHFWNDRFPVYAKWKESWWQNYQKTGKIAMFTGFECTGLMGKNDCINYPVQGAAFHCLLWCFVRLDAIMRKNKWKTKLIGQIHDAILLDVHPDELQEVALTVRLVTTGDLPRNWSWITVPLEIEADLGEVDASWADLKYFELPRGVA